MTGINDYRKEIEYCAYCPKLCRFACPVAEAEQRETVTPTGKMTLLHLLRMGALDWSRDIVEPIYHCTGCLISNTFCEHKIDVFPPFVAAREEAVRRGVAPEKVMLQDRVTAKHHNPYGKNLGRELDGFIPSKYVRRDAEVTLFVGCISTVFYEKHIRNMLHLLEAVGVEIGVYVDEEYHCCGYPSYSLGNRGTFLDIAGNVAQRLSQTGTIVTICPTCANTLREVYPKYGVNIRGPVLHAAQFLYPYFKTGKIGFTKKYGKILYHDPCHLGRYAKVYDEPRELLKACVSELCEFSWNRAESACCGGGGGLLAAAPEVAMKIARKRAAYAREVKPDFIASACPTCDKMMQRAFDKNKVIDLVTILKESLAK